MTWRSILIQNSGKLSLKNQQLFIQQKEEEYTVPLEDIAVIMIESKEVVITAPLLSALAVRGISLLTCDEQFLPCGQWLPLVQYYRPLKILMLQIKASEPQKKQLWQKIVKQKIHNQAIVLNEIGQTKAANKLTQLISKVQSGDKSNQEAQAAVYYFQAAFGKSFTRRQSNAINVHLNYGYSILRSAIARSLVQYGYLVSLGLHHRNELNPFNLADDFIEPFRPIVELQIHQFIQNDTLNETLTTKSKQQLIKLLHHQMRIKDETHTVLNAIDCCISSFQAALKNRQPNNLMLPEIMPLKERCYE